MLFLPSVTEKVPTMSSSAPYPLTGSCNCGDVVYQVNAPFLGQVACHCRQCQQHTQSAFSLVGGLNARDFVIVSGALSCWTKTADSGNRIDCYFCPRCGNRIYHQNPDNPDHIRLKLGTLHNTDVINPTMHIWTEQKQAWYTLPDDVASHPRQPPAQ